MASRDLVNNMTIATTLSPGTRTVSETGSSVDLIDYQACAITAVVGTITDGTHSLTVEESDDDTNWSVVDSSDLQGSFDNLESDTNQKVGYVGFKRYIRVNVSASGTTNGGTYGVSVVRGRPKVAPV